MDVEEVRPNGESGLDESCHEASKDVDSKSPGCGDIDITIGSKVGY